MELQMRGINHFATKYDVKRAIAEALHREGTAWNFEVTLNPGQTTVRNDGTGTLSLPYEKVASKFLARIAREDSIEVQGRAIRFCRSSVIHRRWELQMLRNAPYMDPTVDEEHDRIVQELSTNLRVNRVNFGVYYHDTSRPGAPKAYSKEWEGDYKSRSYAVMRVDYNQKAMQLKLGDPMTEDSCHRIHIKFPNIRKIGWGYDAGDPFICFDLMVPTILERESFNRERIGDDYQDNKQYRHRIGYLDAAHQRVAPYAHQVRVVLCQDQDLEEFKRLCRTAGLRPPIPASIEASRRNFYSQKVLTNVNVWLRKMEWTVAFQIEALLHNGLVNSDELLHDLHLPIQQLYKAEGPKAAHRLRQYTEALQTRPSGESARSCFERVKTIPVPDYAAPAGQFMCHHVSFTPTRMILEGPYVIQSNRVIRSYEGYEENFIRVDFRDEDRLQYRSDHEVKAEFFLNERVGEVLKHGFELAGRNFEFLAYSQSALREHSVWFVHPFNHPQQRYVNVNAEAIRNTLGDFSGVKKYPSKYAARMAQAFTATDPAVKVHRTEWTEIPDMGEAPYEFTDGVGTISRELAIAIWEKLCADHKNFNHTGPVPSVYQIRFLGYKGMVAIDDQLQGKKMCLRPSMNKFRVPEQEGAEIEIARAFDGPSSVCLNRSLVMVLEDRGVRMKSFLDLQNEAVADVMMSGDSIERFRRLLEDHGLGKAYRLSFILQGLYDLGFEFNDMASERKKCENPLLKCIIQYARNHILREMKHRARIPVPNAWCLPGVADEGPAYVARGYENVYCLEPGKIYACIHENNERTWIKGNVIIWRSPVANPGDVQRVWAIGKPPDDQLCLFRNLLNVVVMPSQGSRSMASGLAGGDVDGDTFCICKDPNLLPSIHIEPAEYEAVPPREKEEDSRIEDICDFVVEYIQSDVVGLLSSRHLVIADQSNEGTLDERCIKLAELCSRAVDYPKNGVPIDIDECPRHYMRCRPDWKEDEVASLAKTDYYRSDRAIGHLYRQITLLDPQQEPQGKAWQADDVLYSSLEQLILPYLQSYLPRNTAPDSIHQSYVRYRNELRYIRVIHTLSNDPGARLTEEEVVVSTIVAQCSQHRLRKDRTYRMQVHADALVKEIRRSWLRPEEKDSEEGLRRGLYLAWQAWRYAMDNADRADNDAMDSFGLVALGGIFDALDGLDPDWRNCR
ncbi:RdRP-domain-containing protein [Heliocybe sulcata]|uniref:RNA-dependent RNA polymerase n=1 Tax=Heliocybe sulcata TaxID=5364 RepID=A0A5C3NBK7_9AGAM|nr:RdRP-domain-containing protein [Heliocybe sulcata]